jgi:hypothetical protein
VNRQKKAVWIERSISKKQGAIKAKDSPWDAVLMGSVVSTVITKIIHL